MRGLLTADLHLHPHRPMSTIVDGMNSRLKDGLNVLDHMIDVVNDNDLDFVAIAGDLFEVSPPFAEAYNSLSRKLTALGQISNVYLIAGNHDFRNVYYTGDPMDIPFLDYDRITGVRVLNTNEATTRMQLGDDLTIAGFHHQHLDRLAKELEAVEPANILLLHQMVAGATNDAGFRFPEGFSIDSEVLKKFGTIVCGDIHKPQRPRPGFLIPGAPMHLNFGDESDRYFHVWTDGIVEAVKTKAPKFITVVSEKEKTEDGNFYRIDTRKDRQLERLKLPGSAEAVTDYCKQKDGEKYRSAALELANEIKVEQVVPSDFVLENMELAEFGPFEKVNMQIGRGLHMILGEVVESMDAENSPDDSNGAGKSTLFEGISWTLFAKTAKGIKGASVMRRTRKRGKKCFGKLVFRSETRGELVVTRTQAAKGSKLVIELAGKPYEGRSRDQQKDLVGLLGFSYEFFRQMVYFGQSTAEFFSQMGDADRKQILSKLIGLEWYDAALKVVKSRHEVCETKLVADRNVVEQFITKSGVVVQRIKQLKSDITSWNTEQGERHSVALVKLEGLKEELEKAKKQIADGLAGFDKSVAEEWAALDARHETETENVVASAELTFRSKREALKTEIPALSNQVGEAKRLVESLPSELKQTDKIGTLEGELKIARDTQQMKLSKLTAARQETKRLGLDLEKKRRILSGAEDIEPGTRCVTCGVLITDETKGDYLSHLAEEVAELETASEKTKLETHKLNKEWAAANESVEKLITAVDRARGKLKAIEACGRDVKQAELKLTSAEGNLKELDEAQKTMIELEGEKTRERHQAERERFEKSVQQRRTTMEDQNHQRLQLFERRIGEEQLRADDILNEKCPFEGQLTDAKSELAGFESQRVETEERIKRLEADLELWTFWIKGFGREGIPAALLDGFCTRFTEEANAMLSALSTGMRVNLSPSMTIKSGEVRDRLEYMITTRTGESSYEQLSGGEKVRVDVVSMLTLHSMAATQYGIKEGLLGILILDEVFSALDGSGCQLVYEMLESFQARSICVISHNDVMKSLFRNITIVRKVEETSRLIAA